MNQSEYLKLCPTEVFFNIVNIFETDTDITTLITITFYTF